MVSPNLPLPQTNPGRLIIEDFESSPGASPEDFTQQQLTAVRAYFDTNLFEFARIIFGYQDLTVDFHGRICDFLSKWGQPGHCRLGIEVPRESFKTSLATRANALWQVSRSEGGNATVAIFNAKEANSKKWLKAIREIIMSSKIYQLVYRDLLPPGIAFWDKTSMPRYWKWSDVEIDMVRSWKGIPEASITALGIGGAATGGHWTHIIKDDIIGLEESRSEVQMQAARDWVDAARYLERPAEKGLDLFVYTRWHFNDVYRYVREKWCDEYQVFHRSALEEDAEGNEQSTFPEKWSTEELCRMRDRDIFFFSSQMMCNPKAGREQSFDEEWLRYGHIDMINEQLCFIIDPANYDPTISEIDISREEPPPSVIPLAWMEKCLLWDPAPSEESDKNRERNAKNGLVMAAKDPWGRLFVLSAKGYKLDPEEMMRHSIHVCLQWGSARSAVEEVNFSKVYKHFARYLLRREFPKEHIAFLPQKAEKRSKDARILGLIPDFRSGFIYLNQPHCKQLVLEYKEYPFSTTRDLMDALTMHKDVLFRPHTPEEMLFQMEEIEARKSVMRPGQYDTANWGS